MNQPRLYISLQTDVSILSDFCCGQTNMDNFIHTRLGAFLKSYPTTRLFVVKDESHAIVAMFVLNNGHLLLDDDCKDDLLIKFPEIEKIDYLQDYWESGAFPSIEIDYIAVREDLRNQHIGDSLIHYISSLHKEEATFRDTCFISVSAYCTPQYSAVPFYQKCNFCAAEIKNPYSDTLRMYRAFD